MKHNFIFKAAILIALLVFLAGTPYKVYADVQENIVTTEDGYADKQNDNVSGETDTNEIDNLETPAVPLPYQKDCQSAEGIKERV